MFQRILRVAAFTAALSIAATSVAPTHAHAQTTPLRQQESGFKGMFALGMFGAELGLVIPAAAGLDQWWALVVFPVIGATGGALGGYFGLDRNNQVEASTAILAISIALVVPSVVLTVALRSYDADDDNPAADGDPSVTVTDDAEASARRRSQSIARAGSGLLRRSEYGLHLGMPGVAVGTRGAMTRDDMLMGVRPTTEVRISLFSGVF
ncbi:MAG: hypothetical protein KC593_13790 [Myxococcales bacterium]|nr:hypothetical protein [Myxococcales bacterium]